MKSQTYFILLIASVVTLFLSVFPPYRVVGWGLNGSDVVPYEIDGGRGFFLTGPKESAMKSYQDRGTGYRWAIIDAGQLLVELAIVSSLACLLFALTAPKIREEGMSNQ